MQRNEHFGRGRNRRRDEEGRFAGAGRRTGEHREESRFSGMHGRGGGQGWNRSQGSRFGEGPYRDEGFGGEDYRGMTRGGYPDYGAGDAGWGGGYPGYGEQDPGFGPDYPGRGEGGFGGQGYGGSRASWGEGGFSGRGQGFRGEGAQQGWGQVEEQRHHHDDDYHHWRNEQLRKFDQDYEDWRNERRKKFSEDFDKWRSARPERAAGSRAASQADNKNK
jgi:hypothetical protein